MKQSSTIQSLKQISLIIEKALLKGFDEIGVEVLYDIKQIIGESTDESGFVLHKKLYSLLESSVPEVSELLMMNEEVLIEKINTQSLSPNEMNQTIHYLLERGNQ